MIGLLGVPSARAEEGDSKEVSQAKYDLGKALEEGWSFDGKEHSAHSSSIDDDGVARCEKPLAVLTKLGVPSKSMFRIDEDAPEVEKGLNTLDAGRKSCAQLARAGHIVKWEWRAHQAVGAFAKAGDLHADEAIFRMCLDAYDTMIKRGVKPTDTVQKQEWKEEGKPVVWEGTVESLRKKWCEAGLGNAKEFEKKKDAPYVAVLKADKLSLALNYRSVILKGGGYTDDPKKMAKANLWFVDTEPNQVCANGAQQHVIHRYQFNGHKLAKQSDITTCGTPGSKVFK